MNMTKLRTKDIITVVLLSLVNIVIFSLGTFLYATPVTVLLTPVFYSLLQGIVFFILGQKVPKKGAMLIYSLIMGVMGFYIPYILMFLLGGVLAELILRKTGYGHDGGLTVSYILMQLLACLGSTIYPYTVSLEATLGNIKDGGELSGTIEKAGTMIQSWGSLLLLAAVALAAWIGAVLGRRVARKHLAPKAASSGEAA